MFTSLRLNIRHFFIRNRRKIFIVLLVWLIIMIANAFLKTYTPEIQLNTVYQPHSSIMDSAQTVPSNLQEPIEQLIDTYFNYCNTKQYEQAYAMISDNCKSIYYPTIENFKTYVDTVFDEDKIYYIQNFSNYDDVYIYRVRILENILKTGLTGKQDLAYYEEKISIQEDEQGNLKLSTRQYIKSENLDDVYEDDYMKIWLEKKDVYYEQEVYTMKIKNKTDNIVVIADGTEEYEVFLQVGTQKREATNDNNYIVLQPGETGSYQLKFAKFYDEDNKTYGMAFNAVRVLKSYTGLSITKQQELNNAVKLYSIELPF